MRRIVSTPGLEPMTDGMFLTVIPSAWQQREQLHKRIGDARSRVTQHIGERYGRFMHSGAAIFEWQDSSGGWDCLHEFPPGKSIPRGEFPWQKK